MTTTIGQILLQEKLPEDLHNHGQLNKKGLATLIAQIGKKYPGRYGELVGHIKDMGNDAAYYSGASFNLEDFAPQPELREGIIAPYQPALDHLHEQMNKPGSNYHALALQKVKILTEIESKVNAAVKGHMAEHPTQLSEWATGAGRGDMFNVRQMTTMGGVNLDVTNTPVPELARRSLSEGFSPVDFMVQATGARRGVAQAMVSVRDPGAFAKELFTASSDMVVSSLDCGTHAGRILPVTDPSLLDRCLAEDVPGVGHRNDVITLALFDQIRAHKQPVKVRSPLTCQAEDGICAHCYGLKEDGLMPHVGDHVGIRAAQALCLAAGTEVRMADGSVKPIEAINIGDMVLGSDRSGVIRPVQVLNRYDNGQKEIYKTEFRVGTGQSKNILQLRSTLDHKLLSILVKDHASDRRPSAEIRPVRAPDGGHNRFYAKLPSGYDDTGMIGKDERFALAIGLLIGDGSYTGGATNNGVLFSCYDSTLINEIDSYFIDLGCRLVPQSTDGEYRVSDMLSGKSRKGHEAGKGFSTGIRNSVRAVLVDMGLWGQGSGNKTLPDTSGWSNDGVSKLLAGVYATDGCVYVSKDGRVSITCGSNSFALLEGIRYLLMTRFGIYPSSIAGSRKKKTDGSDYDANYQLHINGHDNVNRFSAAINIPGVKGPRLRNAVEKWSKSNLHLESGRSSFISQVPIGLANTYDIEVDHPDHLFVLANGLIVSNSEPLTQLALSAKHTGGVVGKVSPLKSVLNFLEAPKSFPGMATLARAQGAVQSIQAAPAGGHYLVIGGIKHFAAPDLALKVKVGDVVHRGDALTDGTPHPGEVVHYRGMGPGRDYFSDHLHRIYADNGIAGHKKVFETVTRSVLNLGQVIDPGHLGDEYAPGAIVRWNRLQPHVEAAAVEDLAVAAAHGRFLAAHAGHLAPGDLLTPKDAKKLAIQGITTVKVYQPGALVAKPIMLGVERAALNKGDWMSNLAYRYIRQTFKENAATAQTANTAGYNPIPAYIHGATFGQGKDGRY